MLPLFILRGQLEEIFELFFLLDNNVGREYIQF